MQAPEPRLVKKMDDRKRSAHADPDDSQAPPLKRLATTAQNGTKPSSTEGDMPDLEVRLPSHESFCPIHLSFLHLNNHHTLAPTLGHSLTPPTSTITSPYLTSPPPNRSHPPFALHSVLC